MHIQTPLRSLPATAGSHVQRAILSQAPRMKRHISPRARIGLRGGEKVGISTASTTVARSFNSNARSSSQVKVLDGHQAAALIVFIRMFFGRMYLLRSSASSFLLRTKTGTMATTCGYVPVQSAWSGDVGDGRNRYMRPNRSAGIARLRKSFRQIRYRAPWLQWT